MTEEKENKQIFDTDIKQMRLARELEEGNTEVKKKVDKYLEELNSFSLEYYE